MSFRFNLESILKHRQRLEEIAQREFAEAQAEVDACLRQLEEMYQRLDEVRFEIAAAQGRSQVGQVVEMESFITGHKVRIEKVRQQARELLAKAEAKQEVLIACAREKKVLVKLKEKRMLEHKERLNRLEAKAQDEQTMMRQGWGKR